jgi:hypothetical protein
MSAVKLQAPVVSTKVNAQQVEDMRGAVNELADGEFASDGEQYGKRTTAGSMAATYLRMLAINKTHRARTWEVAPEKWVFGIAPRPPKRESTKKSEATPATKK